MKTFAIILLAGSSTRFKSSVKKQYFEIDKKPLFYYAINSFESSKIIDEITLVVSEGKVEEFKNACKEFNFKKVTNIVEGGKERQNSVYNGLKSLNSNDEDIVYIHDGARPIVPEEVITNCFKEVQNSGAVTTAIKAEDTMALSESNMEIASFVDREKLYRIQTPQVFKFSIIFKAHKIYNNETLTDDAQLVSKLGIKVKIVEGSKVMNKVTTIEDIKYLKETIENV